MAVPSRSLQERRQPWTGPSPHGESVPQGFKDEVLIHGALLDIDVEVVHRNPADQGKGFVPQPKRWIVE
jgi:hypothetical protein